MWKAIDLKKIDELYKLFNFINKDNKNLVLGDFKEFIESAGENKKGKGDGFPVWDWVDSIGVVTPEDFEGAFDKEFIEKNFEDLAHDWFSGLCGQIDFGMLLDCIKEDWEDRYEKWKERSEYDFCDRCEKRIDQIDLGDGSFGCPICKCDDQISIYKEVKK